MLGIKYLLTEVKKEKELMRSSLLMFIAIGLQSFTSFLVNLILARIFIPESFGNFKTTLYLITFFTALIGFGAPITLTKYIAQFKTKEKEKIAYMTRWFLKLRLGSFFVLSVLLLIFLKPVTIYFLHDPSLSYLILFGFSLIFANIFAILPSMTLGYENFKLYLTSRIVMSLSSLVFGIGLGYLFGVPYAILGSGISNLLANLTCLKFLIKKDSFKKRDGVFGVKKIFFKFSFPMYVLQIPSFFGNAIVPLLSLFFPMELIGQYSFSFIFYLAGLVLPMSLANTLLPRNSRLVGLEKDKKASESLKKVFVAYTVIVVLGIIGVLLLGRLFLIIIAPEYLPGLLFFKVLVSLGLIMGYIVIYNSYLTAREKIGKVAILTLIQNLVLFLVSFFLLSSV